MNIPVSNFKRDEAYTFIHGIAIACIWFIYLTHKNIIDSIKSLATPRFIIGWLLSTAFLYILYLLLSHFVSSSVKKMLKKKNDDVLLKEEKDVVK